MTHNFDPLLLICQNCGLTAELLKWKGELVPCKREAVAQLKRDRYFFDLGRTSRNDEVGDLELKALCLEMLLMRTYESMAETVIST